MLALLAQDLADIPADLLARAIDKHVATSPYMPKAADLIRLAQEFERPATSLEAYVDELNQTNFSRANGWHWFINQRTLDNGNIERFLDRRDNGPASTRWTPREGEREATDEVVAELIREGVEQTEFNMMVERGIVSRKVDAKLALRAG